MEGLAAKVRGQLQTCRICNLQYLQNTYIFRKKTFASAAFFGSAVPDDSLAMR